MTSKPAAVSGQATPPARLPRETIRLGFIPLLDAAIPIIAADKGFAAARGLDLQLIRETSWANIRDRLAIGHFDAAHLLAPMSVAAALGLTPLDVPLIAPMALGLGGNAITVSDALWQQMRAVEPEVVANDPFSVGAALKHVIRSGTFGRSAVPRKPTLAVVHPYSAHNYELRYWLAASGIRPDEDIDIAILPPPLMPDALASGTIDGFCVGEPWNSNAARRFGGRIILTKSAIWKTGPEKVLGLRADWAETHPETVAALLAAMLDAASWCADPANIGELGEILARPNRLNLPVADITAPLDGGMLLADGARHVLPEFMVFGGGPANRPSRAAALWFLSQMARWGQTRFSPEAATRAEASFRPDIFLSVAGPGAAFRSGDVLQPIGGFFDGLDFDPAGIEDYLAAQMARDRA